MATCDGGCRFDFVPLVYHGVDVMDLIRYVEVSLSDRDLRQILYARSSS